MIEDSYRRLSLHYTYQCTIACEHCITVSSPQRTERVPFAVAEEAVATAIELGFYQLAFTGGEALIHKDEVFTLTRRASTAGLNVLIMTNGFWARNEHGARRMADEMADVGVSHVCVSTDRYHIGQGLPFEVCFTAARELKDRRIKAKVQYARERDDPFADAFLEEARRQGLVVDVFPIYPFGRAARFERALLLYDEEAPDVRCPFGPLIMPDLQVIKCCGGDYVSERAHDEHPAVLGDLRHESFRDIITRALRGDDVLTMAFCAWGPKKLGQVLGEDFWKTEELAPFYGMCDLCCRLLNDPERVERLREKLSDPAQRRKIRRHAAMIDAFDRNGGGRGRWDKSWDYDESRESQ